MKVAVAITSETEFSAHFGRSPAFLVLRVENGQIQQRELRANDQAGHGSEPPHDHAHPHAQAHDHSRFVQLLGDCQAVLGLGMGAGARHALEAAGLQVRVLAAPCAPEEAALRFAAGALNDQSVGCCGGGHPHP